MSKVNTKLVISELHKAFGFINRDYFEGKLPEPAILIQSRGNKKLTLGWCSVNKIWVDGATNVEKYEINLVAESLNRGMIPVLTTLFHEMVHLHNLENGIKDVTRGNTYHNKRFKEEAEKRGLLIEHDDKIGYSPTTMLPATVERMYSYGIIEDAFMLARKDTSGGEKEKKKKKSSSRKYTCPECGTTVRASKDVLILCGLCTSIEDQKVVPMIKEASEDDEPVVAPMAEFCCNDCGVVFEAPEDSMVCPECGATEIMRIDTTEEEPVEEPVEIEEPIEIEVPAPVIVEPTIIEVDTELDDGAGNMIPVKQGFIVPVEEEETPIVVEENLAKKEWSKEENTGWDEARVRAVLVDTAKWFEELEGKTIDVSEVEIKLANLKNGWGSWHWKYKKTRGRGADKIVTDYFKFANRLLERCSDYDVVDVIKHEYVHCWLNCTTNKDYGHNELFKRYCNKVGTDGKATHKRPFVK